MDCSRGVGHTERVASAEAVASDADFGRASGGTSVGDGGFEKRLDYAGGVLGNESCAVVVGIIHVCWRWTAVE